jgi:hypothetical protein
MSPAENRPCRRCSIALPNPAAGPTAIDRIVGGGAAVPEPLPVNILTAYHEAAHLVVGHLVGTDPATSVAINPDGSAVVRRPFDLTGTADDPALLRVRVRRRIVSALAGGAADQRTGRRGWSWLVDEEVVDRLTAWIGHVGLGHSSFLAPLRDLAHMAVHDGWPLILDLADLLVDQRCLPGSYLTAWLEGREDAVSLRSYYSAAFDPVEAAV